MSKILSSKGELSKTDKISALIYTGIFIVSSILPDFINVIAPFLNLDALICSNRFITLTLGNIITILLFVSGVIIKKLSNNGEAVEKKILEQYLDNKESMDKPQ